MYSSYFSVAQNGSVLPRFNSKKAGVDNAGFITVALDFPKNISLTNYKFGVYLPNESWSHENIDKTNLSSKFITVPMGRFMNRNQTYKFCIKATNNSYCSETFNFTTKASYLVMKDAVLNIYDFNLCYFPSAWLFNNLLGIPAFKATNVTTNLNMSIMGKYLITNDYYRSIWSGKTPGLISISRLFTYNSDYNLINTNNSFIPSKIFDKKNINFTFTEPAIEALVYDLDNDLFHQLLPKNSSTVFSKSGTLNSSVFTIFLKHNISFYSISKAFIYSNLTSNYTLNGTIYQKLVHITV